MFNFRKWLAARKLASRNRAFAEGYRYAAGALLDSDGYADPMAAIVNDGVNVSFDNGIREACFDWAQMQQKHAAATAHKPRTAAPGTARVIGYLAENGNVNVLAPEARVQDQITSVLSECGSKGFDVVIAVNFSDAMYVGVAPLARGFA